MSGRAVAEGLMKLEELFNVKFSVEQAQDFLSVFEDYDENVLGRAIEAACRGQVVPSIADLTSLCLNAQKPFSKLDRCWEVLRYAFETDDLGDKYRTKVLTLMRGMERDFPGDGWGRSANNLTRFLGERK